MVANEHFPEGIPWPALLALALALASLVFRERLSKLILPKPVPPSRGPSNPMTDFDNESSKAARWLSSLWKPGNAAFHVRGASTGRQPSGLKPLAMEHWLEREPRNFEKQLALKVRCRVQSCMRTERQTAKRIEARATKACVGGVRPAEEKAASRPVSQPASRCMLLSAPLS